FSILPIAVPSLFPYTTLFRSNDWTELPIPDFYDPANASRWSYSPDQQKLFEAAVEWRKLHGIRPAQEDDYRIHLLLIDYQKDFRSEEHTSELQSRENLVCRLL